jgi:hypothetical protein
MANGYGEWADGTIVFSIDRSHQPSAISHQPSAISHAIGRPALIRLTQPIGYPRHRICDEILRDDSRYVIDSL